MEIKLITCQAGDWEVLQVDGVTYYEGHSIRGHEYLELINNLIEDANVVGKEISDEEMEMGEY